MSRQSGQLIVELCDVLRLSLVSLLSRLPAEVVCLVTTSRPPAMDRLDTYKVQKQDVVGDTFMENCDKQSPFDKMAMQK